MSEIRYKGQIYSGAAAFGGAEDVSYDNTASGLTSTNVQDALDEIADGGSGSTGCVELTQAQYDALTEEEQMADVIYLITDSPDNYLDEVFGDFASVEYTSTASKAYSVGDYIVYDGKFYKVTTAITQGGTITPGTNVAQTTVGDEFKKITETEFLTIPSTYSLNLRRYGKICVLNCDSGTFKVPDTDWNELATIPSGYRPGNILYYSNYNSTAKMALSPDGRWFIQGPVANTTYYAISTLTYIIP